MAYKGESVEREADALIHSIIQASYGTYGLYG